MKTFRSLSLWSAVGLVGLWGCNSNQYTTANDAEYDDLYGNSSSVAIVAKPGNQDEEKRSLHNYNPDYRIGQQQPNTTSEDYDYYDESYLSSRGIQRNVGPNAGYNAGFSDGYQTAINNNWGSYWNNPYRYNSFGWNSFGSSAMMLGLGYGFGSSFGNPYRFGSPFGWNSAFAYGYGDPFFSPYSYYSPYSAWGGYSNFGWGSPWGFNSFNSPYNFYGSGFYGNNFYGNNNLWYNGPNNIQIVDARRRPGSDYYNRVDRSANSYNRNNDNSPRYTNDGRRQSYDPSSRANSSSTATSSDTYYSRPRGGADRSYNGYSSNSGSRTGSTYSAPSTQSSGYSSGTRGGATRSYGESSTYSNQRSSSYSNNNSSNSNSSSWNNNSSSSGRSSYSSPSPSYSSPSSSSGSSSSSSSGSSRGPR